MLYSTFLPSWSPLRTLVTSSCPRDLSRPSMVIPLLLDHGLGLSSFNWEERLAGTEMSTQCWLWFLLHTQASSHKPIITVARAAPQRARSRVTFQGLPGIAAITARLIAQCLLFQKEEEASYQFHNLETLCSQMKQSRYTKSEV